MVVFLIYTIFVRTIKLRIIGAKGDNMKRILSLSRQAIQKYNMISENDTVAVGVSGGKDSLVLLCTLTKLSEFYPLCFKVKAISIDAGFDGCNFDEIKKLCLSLGIEHKIVKSPIKEIVFNNIKPKSPCALCSKMRRAALCDEALKMGCNKLALGHNLDDAIETFMMNTLYNGNAMCFEPITHYDDKGISIIRPLVFAPEYAISRCAGDLVLPVMKKICPMDGNTKREETKEIIANISQKNKNAKKNIFTAIKNLPEFKKYEVTDANENDG